MATAAVLAVVHGCHEDASAAFGLGTLPPETLDFAVAINLVVLEDSQLGLLPLVLDLFGSGVDLLLPLLSTTAQTKDKVQSRLLLDVVVGERTAVLELLAGEDKTLLVRGNALLVCVLLAGSLERYRTSKAYPESWTSHYRWCPRTPPQG